MNKSTVVEFNPGDRVVVLTEGCRDERGRGVVVEGGRSKGYVAVRFDGECGWYEWSRLWCYREDSKMLVQLRAVQAEMGRCYRGGQAKCA